MWPDNETDIDLLGFDFLVDELLVLLKEPRLLPVTIGVAGDWGSGKSSLLAMAAKGLEDDADTNTIVVRFSPWRFEDYEDVKGALMVAVMRALVDSVNADKTNIEKSKDLFVRLVKRVRWMSVVKTAAGAVIASQAGVSPEIASLLAGGWVDTTDLEATPDGDKQEPTSIAEFREQFDALMAGLEDVSALVVFVDDLDRCMPDTIIDTFEAIRLFLHVPKTAYVIAADQRVVRGAIENRYPSAIRDNPSIGTDYLEKILQVTVSIPPLSTPEAESYINLLMADAYVTPEVMSRLRDAAKVERGKGYLSVCMNEGIARAALDGNLGEDLVRAFAVASRISPTLARKHNGNPRQIKRFMNTLMLRQRAAQRRAMNLDISVLAKLMILEEVDPTAYRRLFGWQAEAGGKPIQIAEAEAYATEDKRPASMSDATLTWADRPEVKPWLTLEPLLAKVDLAPYFFFSRDRFSPALPAARLTPDQQTLLANLQSESDGARLAAIEQAIALAPEDLAAVYPALLAVARLNPAGPAMEVAVTVASRASATVADLVATLEQIPEGTVPPKMVPMLRVRFKPLPASLEALIDRWSKGTGPLAKAAGLKPATAAQKPGKGH
jgi:hypothetical protein